MYKDYRFVDAGENEIYRYGRKARERMTAYLEPNEKGFYSLPADGGKYYTIGTSEGKYGEFAKFEGKFLSVNSAGYVWAKAGTEKAETFKDMIKSMIATMEQTDAERIADIEASIED